MANERVKEILEKQLELLFEYTKKFDNYVGARELTKTMIELANVINDFDR